MDGRWFGVGAVALPAGLAHNVGSARALRVTDRRSRTGEDASPRPPHAAPGSTPGGAHHDSPTMTEPRDTAFALENGLSMEDVEDGLAARFGIRALEQPPEHAVYWDTFDARLGRAGAALGTRIHQGRTHLVWESDRECFEQPVRVRKPLGFVHDMPEGPVRDAAAPVVDVRRLIPLVELERERQLLELLDDEEKVVARIRLEHARAREPGRESPWVDLPPVIRVVGVRGYDDSLEAALAMLRATPGVAPSGTDVRDVALRALGKDGLTDPSSLAVDLSPGLRADSGMRRVHLALLDVMTANEAGVRDGSDTEFLHDFRVAIRRTRSLLGQLQDVFPTPMVNHFRAEFADLGSATSATRDLDVFLLRLDQDTDLLEGADLTLLRASVAAARNRAHRALVATLDSPRYATLKDTWRLFLESGETGTPLPPAAPRPLREVVSSRLMRIYRKIGKQRRRLGRDAPPAELHRVRLTAKKMRYLLDCCRAAYDPEDIDPLIGPLRKLQNALGRFNDAEVQDAMLAEGAAAMIDDDRADADVLLAMGRLQERLRRAGDRERRRSLRRLRRFTDEKHRARFAAVFGEDDA